MNFTLFTTADGLSSNVINDIAVDKNGVLWAGTAESLCKYDGGGFLPDTTPGGSGKITALFMDTAGNIRVGTPNGLNCFRDGERSSYTTKEGLSNNNVRALSVDGSGDTWIGTWSGLSRLSGDTVTSYYTKNGLPHNFIFSIIQDIEVNGWLGTAGGLGCLKSLDRLSFTTRDGLSDNGINAIIADRRGRTWFGTDNGVNRYDKGNFKSYSTA
ncbi:MAG: hypothetical protein GY765_38430, partial [bacterium]|nr:hypothetical protein [bacterium]